VRLGGGNGATTIPGILDYLIRTSHGSRTDDDPVLRNILLPGGLWAAFEHLAYGLNLTIGCREERPHINAAALRAEGKAFYPYVVAEAVETDFDAACPALKIAPVANNFYDPLISRVPTLILTGTYDTFIPTSRSDTIAKSLPYSILLRFRGLGHDIINSSSCAAALVDAFIRSPRTPLDANCAERHLPPIFDLKVLSP
jgi:pimeloyl-ACP methyl ester carboxylesterase